MALIAKSETNIILSVQRSIFVLNTNDLSHSVVKLPEIARKKTETNGNGDEKISNEEKSENNNENIDDEPVTERDQIEFGDINRLTVSPCNKYIAVTTIGDKFLFLYQLDNGTLCLLKSHQLGRATSALRFTSDSKHLLIADKTGDCFLIDCQSDSNDDGKWILGHLSIVLDILMTRDSKFIITCDRDEKIRITNYPQSEVVESYCLGHTEFVSAIEEVIGENQLISLSGDRTMRLWNYLDGSELFRLELSARGLRLEQNSQCELAAVLFDENYEIGLFERAANENKPELRMLFKYSLEKSVKYVSSIVYETDDSIWVSGLDENKEIVLKNLKISRGNGKINIDECDSDKVLNILKQNLPAMKVQPNEDITQLFKKSFDNLTDYQERKKRRIEQKYGK